MTQSTAPVKNGSFCFYRTSSLTQGRTEAALEVMARSAGVSEEYTPDYVGDRRTATRAIERASVGLYREDFILRPVKRTGEEVTFAIVKETTDEKGRRVSHGQEGTVTWRAESPTTMTSHTTTPEAQAVATRVLEKYRAMRGLVLPDDWGPAIRRFLLDTGAASMRPDGRIFWCPPQRDGQLQTFAALLKQVGITVVTAPVAPEAVEVVKEAAQEDLGEALKTLQEEVASFDGRQKPSTYEKRLKEYQKLKERAILYRDALGIGVDQARETLETLEEKVGEMLHIRSTTTIPRKKKAAPAVSETLHESESIGSFRFAGTLYEEAGTKGDAAIFAPGEVSSTLKARFATMANTGMVKRWLPAGTLKVCLSGPDKCQVAIHGLTSTLTDHLVVLRNLGMEVQ